MSIGLDVHGPLKATSRAQTGASYGTLGVVKITDEADRFDITIFAPSPEAAAHIAYAINAAFSTSPTTNQQQG